MQQEKKMDSFISQVEKKLVRFKSTIWIDKYNLRLNSFFQKEKELNGDSKAICQLVSILQGQSKFFIFKVLIIELLMI